MIGNKKLLALVTARGGSKRLPGKNILDLAGKPLIAWSIEAGLNSKYVDRVVVTTDDDEIAKVSTKYGADVPFMRPEELASDTASSIDVVRHAITKLEESGDSYDYLMLLQPTSPLRLAHHIDEAVGLLIEKNADSIVGVCEIEHPVEWSNTLPCDNSMNDFIPDSIQGKRSQDFPTRYRINGAIYLVEIQNALAENSLFLKNNVYATVMDRESSLDIDVEYDFSMAKCILLEY